VIARMAANWIRLESVAIPIAHKSDAASRAWSGRRILKWSDR
jgi:hypothetical protein